MTDQSLSSESERPGRRDGVVPIPAVESELKDRLADVVGDESKSAFARRCGFGESTLRKYLEGADPSTSRLVSMALAGNVTVEWLATGKGQRSRAPAGAPATQSLPLSDRSRLATAVQAVEEGLASVKRTMPPVKKAELICAAYDLLSQGAGGSAQIIQFIKLAA